MEEMLTVREIQAILKVSRATIWAWMRRRVDPMPSFKLGTALRFRRSEVERWVQKQRPVVIAFVARGVDGDMAGGAMHGTARLGRARQGMAGEAWLGEDRQGPARHGQARHGRQG